MPYIVRLAMDVCHVTYSLKLSKGKFRVPYSLRLAMKFCHVP